MKYMITMTECCGSWLARGPAGEETVHTDRTGWVDIVCEMDLNDHLGGRSSLRADEAAEGFKNHIVENSDATFKFAPVENWGRTIILKWEQIGCPFCGEQVRLDHAGDGRGGILCASCNMTYHPS